MAAFGLFARVVLLAAPALLLMGSLACRGVHAAMRRRSFISFSAPVSEEQLWFAPAPSSAGLRMPAVTAPRVVPFGERDDCVPAAVCGRESRGRLGNALFMLERALWLARSRNLCFVKIGGDYGVLLSDFMHVPPDGVLRLQRGKEHVPAGEIPCNLTCMGYMCHVKKVLDWPMPGVKALREVAQEMILPRLACDWAKLPRVDNDTLVMQMRGGDAVFDKNIMNGWYPQPPCAFWFHAMRYGNNGGPFPKGLVVTERWHGNVNPCAEYLRRNFSGRVTVQEGLSSNWYGTLFRPRLSREPGQLPASPQRDACTILKARHLAVSFSTFGCALARLAPNLEDLHAPFGEDAGPGNKVYGGASFRKGMHWYNESLVWEAGGVPYRQHVYSFPNYTCNWGSPAARQRAMAGYNHSLVLARTIDAYEVGLNNTGPMVR